MGGREGGNRGGSKGGSDDAMQGESVSGGRRKGGSREVGLMKGTSEEGTERGMDDARERGEGGCERRRD